LYSILRPAFRTGPYQKLREKILFDREKARLPDTQEDARRCREATDRLAFLEATREPTKKAIQVALKNLPELKAFKAAERAFEKTEAYRSLREEFAAHDAEANRLRESEPDSARHMVVRDKRYECKNKLELLRTRWEEAAAAPLYAARAPLNATLSQMDTEIWRANEVLYRWGLPEAARAAAAGGAGGAGAATSAKAGAANPRFVMKCVKTKCEGFLSTDYKCGLCDVQVCAECHTVKEDGHFCDPATVASIKQIRKEARPCPTCTTLISKIDGCDQIWCTQCHTAFSWTTGRVDTGVVHNPHYFQYMRIKGQEVPRRHNPGFGCAEVQGIHPTLLRIYREMDGSKALVEAAMVTYQEMIHVREVDLLAYREEQAAYLRQEWRRVLRVKRLMNLIDDETWMKTLQKKEKSNYKVTAWVHLLEMYTTVSLETLARITSADNLEAVYEEYRKVRDYTIQEAKAIAKVYGCVLPESLRDEAPPA